MPTQEEDKIEEKKQFEESKSNVKQSNPAQNVGGTAKDGGLSTAATVADGGPDDKEDDPTWGK